MIRLFAPPLVSALLCVATLGTPALAQRDVAADRSAVNAEHAFDTLLARRVSVHIDKLALDRAIKRVAEAAGVEVQFGAEAVDRYAKIVTFDGTRVPLGEVFAAVLSGTRLQVTPVTATALVIREMDALGVHAQGGVSGHVRDARTGRPLAHATVVLDGATRGVVTDEQGAFRVTAVGAGAHTITVRCLGYVRQSQRITVSDGVTASLEVALEVSVSQLDQVVVTGTVVAVERRAVPNAMTVITAKDIEQRGITHIDQLFRGEVPGLFVQNIGSSSSDDAVHMFSRGGASLDVGAGAAIKTYVDGVEMADPQYLNNIDPRSIERIEIIPGPQASTIYGSNAINGVMQIFTKRGTSARPHVVLTLLSGGIENAYSSSVTPQHDFSAQVTGAERRMSYSAGASWGYQGSWTPGRVTTTPGAFGGLHLQLGAFAADVSGRISERHIEGSGSDQGTSAAPIQAVSQIPGVLGQNGTYAYSVSAPPLSPNVLTTIRQQSLGFTATYTPISWWVNEFIIGSDGTTLNALTRAPLYSAPRDSLLSITQSTHQRTSLRYSSTLTLPLSTWGRSTLTVGADGWQDKTTSMNAFVPSLTGTLVAVNPDGSAGSILATRQPDHNLGGFVQWQVAWRDALFLTYGLRAERNPNYGDAYGTNYAPRYGVAYTYEAGPFSAKVRGSYGRATRPPTVDEKKDQLLDNAFLTPLFGAYHTQVSAPDLGPEYQQGGEGGVELYWGTRGSVTVTRYRQTVDGLITPVQVDSQPSLVVDPYYPGCCGGTYAQLPIYQNQNLGRVRNDGWELQGSVNTGPFTTRGTYSWTESRILYLSPSYLANPYRVYDVGQPLQQVPEHTWAVDVSYVQAATSVRLTVSGAGQSATSQYNDELFAQLLYLRLDTGPRAQGNNVPVAYRIVLPGYAQMDLNLSHRFAAHLEGIGQVLNLTNQYRNDQLSGLFPVMGRQAKVGVRIQ